MKKFLLKHVVGPFLGNIAGHLGEAIGQRAAKHINPDVEEECSHEVIVQGKLNGQPVAFCGGCGCQLELPDPDEEDESAP